MPGAAHVQIRQWMEEAGLTTWIDAVGNVHGRTHSASAEASTARTEGTTVSAGGSSAGTEGDTSGGSSTAGAGSPAVVIGSHYDTVNDAGRYDGPLGIIAGAHRLCPFAAGFRHSSRVTL